MKQLSLILLFALALCATPCHAQLGTFGKILKGAKTAIETKKSAEKKQKDQGDQKLKDVYNSPEYQKAREDAQRLYEEQLEAKQKEREELEKDSAAMEKYMQKYMGGMSPEEYTKSIEEKYANDKDFQKSMNQFKQILYSRKLMRKTGR